MRRHMEVRSLHTCRVGVHETRVVAGACRFGREAAAWKQETSPNDELLGHLDNDSSTHGRPSGDHIGLGGLAWLDSKDVDDVIFGFGAPSARRAVASALARRSLTPTTAAHAAQPRRCRRPCPARSGA